MKGMKIGESKKIKMADSSSESGSDDEASGSALTKVI